MWFGEIENINSFFFSSQNLSLIILLSLTVLKVYGQFQATLLLFHPKLGKLFLGLVNSKGLAFSMEVIEHSVWSLSVAFSLLMRSFLYLPLKSFLQHDNSLRVRLKKM